MTKLLVVSDSHGLTKRLETIAERHEVDLNIHCGDSELEKTAQALDRFTVVKGNCDFENRFPEYEVIDIDGLRIFVTHGHLYDVKSSLMQLRYRALELESDIVLFGHSHIAYCEQIDQQLFINPGSIRQARYWNVRSYCLITWQTPSKIEVKFYDISGKELDSFPFEQIYAIK